MHSSMYNGIAQLRVFYICVMRTHGERILKVARKYLSAGTTAHFNYVYRVASAALAHAISRVSFCQMFLVHQRKMLCNDNASDSVRNVVFFC